MDAIQIIIKRDVNADGTGGTIIDNATGVLGALPDGTPVLDALAAAFGEAYGVVELPTGNKVKNEQGEEVDETAPAPFRNISYRMRLFGAEVLSGYAQNQARKLAAEQASQAVSLAESTVTIVEG